MNADDARVGPSLAKFGEEPEVLDLCNAFGEGLTGPTSHVVAAVSSAKGRTGLEYPSAPSETCLMSE